MPRTTIETKVSRYDRFQAMLTSLVVLTGFSAVLLFLIWLTTVLKIEPTPATVTIFQNSLARGEHVLGSSLDTEIPVEELPDTQQSQISVAFKSLSGAIAAQKNSFAAFDRRDVTSGTGKGDRRPGRLANDNPDVIPPWKRWRVQFAASSQDDFARQLDALQIELGALSRNSPEIQYASKKLSTVAPDSRTGSRNNESRLFFVHLQHDPLITFSRGLLQNVGIETDNRLIAQFFSDDAFRKLRTVEQSLLGNRSLASVRRTVFGVRQAGSGFEFYVIRYEFLP